MKNLEENDVKIFQKNDIKEKLKEGITIQNDTQREAILNALGILSDRQQKKRKHIIIVGLIIFFSLLLIGITFDGKLGILISSLYNAWNEICQNPVKVIYGIIIIPISELCRFIIKKS